MKLTHKQQEMAIALRKLIQAEIVAQPVTKENRKIPTSYEHFVDLTRAVGCILEGTERFASPNEMIEFWDEAWKSYLMLWASENNRIILNALRGDIEMFNKLAAHPNAPTIFNRILSRINDTPSGEEVEIGDILAEEMIDFPNSDLN